ncbi:MAG TPA: hypothetical protein VM452_11650 [Caulifigura sp.]|jgi:hypothetical protein|nr:hypothetical protein [Caulifigura sp.]
MQYLITLEAPVHFKNLPLGTLGIARHPVVIAAADDLEARKLAGQVSESIEGSRVVSVVKLTS